MAPAGMFPRKHGRPRAFVFTLALPPFQSSGSTAEDLCFWASRVVSVGWTRPLAQYKPIALAGVDVVSDLGSSASSFRRGDDHLRSRYPLPTVARRAWSF